MPQTANDFDAPRLDLCRLGVLILVDHVLVEAFGDQPLRLRLHPRRDERREVHARVAIEHQLVMDDLKCSIRIGLTIGDAMTRNGAGGGQHRVEGQVTLIGAGSLGMVEGHVQKSNAKRHELQFTNPYGGH